MEAQVPHILGDSCEAGGADIEGVVDPIGRMGGCPPDGVAQVADHAAVAAASEAVLGVRLADEVIGYVVSLIRSTRGHPDLANGASPRAASALAAAARAAAALEGRDYVIPDDVKLLAQPLLRHRVVLSPAAEIDGRRADDIVAQLIDRVEAPR